MAQYIDRDLIKWYGCNFENPSCENRDCSDCSHAECSHTQIMQIPTADVIERSNHLKQVKYIQDNLQTYIDNIRDNYFAMERRYNKLKADVDKAIAEIEGEYSTCNQDWVNGLNRALEILKRNIGE